MLIKSQLLLQLLCQWSEWPDEKYTPGCLLHTRVQGLPWLLQFWVQLATFSTEPYFLKDVWQSSYSYFNFADTLWWIKGACSSNILCVAKDKTSDPNQRILENFKIFDQIIGDIKVNHSLSHNERGYQFKDPNDSVNQYFPSYH